MSVMQGGDSILMKHNTELKIQNSDFCGYSKGSIAFKSGHFYLENVIFQRQTKQDILQRWCYRPH